MGSFGRWSTLTFVILCACPGILSEDAKKESKDTVSMPQQQKLAGATQKANAQGIPSLATSEDVSAHIWQAPYEIHMVGDPREMRDGWIYQFGNQHPAAGDSQTYHGVPQEHWHKQLDAQVQSFAPSYRNLDQNSVAFNEVDPYAAYRTVGSPNPGAPKFYEGYPMKQTVNGKPDAPERDMSHMEIIKQAWEKSSPNVQKVAPLPQQVDDDAAKRPELPPLIFPKDVPESEVIGASPLEPCSGEVLLSPEQPQLLSQQPNQFEPRLQQQMPMFERNPQQQPTQQMLAPTLQQRMPMNGQPLNLQQQPMATPTNLRQEMPMLDQSQNRQQQQQTSRIPQTPEINLRQQMPMYEQTQNAQRNPSTAEQIPTANLRQQMMIPAEQKTNPQQIDERQLAQQQQFQFQQSSGLNQDQNLRQQMPALSEFGQRQMAQQQTPAQLAFDQRQMLNQQPMLQLDQGQTSNQRQMPQLQTFTVANARMQDDKLQSGTQQQASQNLVLNVNPNQQDMFIIDQNMPQSTLQQSTPEQQMLIPGQKSPQQMTFRQIAQQQPMYLPEQHPTVQQQHMPSFAQNMPSANIEQTPTWDQAQYNQQQMPTSLNVQMQPQNLAYQASNQQIDQVKLDEMKAIMEDMPDVRTIHLIKKLKKQQNHQPNYYITIPAVYGGYAGGYSSPSSYARQSTYYRPSSYGYGNSQLIGSSNPSTPENGQEAKSSGESANTKTDSSSAPGSPTDKSSLTGDEFQEIIASENLTSRTLNTSPITAEEDDMITAASEADAVEISSLSDGRVCNCKHNHIEQDDDEDHHVAAVPIDLYPDGRFVSYLSDVRSSGVRRKRRVHGNQGYRQEINEAIKGEFSSSSLDPLDTSDALGVKPRQGRYTPQNNAYVDFNPNQYLPVREIDLNSKDQTPGDGSNIYKNLVQQTEQSIREAIAKATRSSGPVQVVNEPDVAPTSQYSSDIQEQPQIIPLDEYLRQNPPAMRKVPMRVNLNPPASGLSSYHRPSLAGISDQAPVSLQRNPFETWYKPPNMMKHPLQIIIQSIESRLSSCCEACKAEVLNEISDKLRLNTDGQTRLGHKCSRTVVKPTEHDEYDVNSEEQADSEEIDSHRTQKKLSGRGSGVQESRPRVRYSSKHPKTSRKKVSDYESNEEVEDDFRAEHKSKSSRNENRRKLKTDNSRASNRRKTDTPKEESPERSQDRRKSTSAMKSSKLEKLIQRLIELDESTEARDFETIERRPKKSREEQSIRKSKLTDA